jgi:DNA transformation protein
LKVEVLAIFISEAEWVSLVIINDQFNTEIMGNKGDKSNKDSVLAAEFFVEKLASISDITSKKMFGGHGIFHEGKMFGLINAKGYKMLKASGDFAEELIELGSEKLGKMPYYAIPTSVLENHDELLLWVHKAIEKSKK